MQIAILLCDRFTALDAVGPYEVLGRLPGARTVFVSARRGELRSDIGSLGITADATLDEVPSPDVVLVPGGPGVMEVLDDDAVLGWLRTADATSTWTTSVCNGSLLLAAAGLLNGRRATTHWMATELLKPHGAHPVDERVVADGKYVTAAGVSAGIDMALTLAGRMAGDDLAQLIQLAIEYDPQPPYDSGSQHTASPEVLELFHSRARELLSGA